jgi:hypothetical protein
LIKSVPDNLYSESLSLNDLARMHLLNSDSNARSSVRILGISGNGVDLLSPISVRPGTLIQLQHKDIFLLGEARRCEAVGSTFEVGIDIQDAYRRVAQPSPEGGSLRAGT